MPGYDLELLQQIVDLGARLLKARYGALGVLSERGDGFDQFLTTGLGEEARAAIGRLPEGRGLLGALLRDPRPFRVRDIAEDPRGVGFPKNHPPMRSFLGLPLVLGRTVCGAFYFTDKEGEAEFLEVDEHLADCFGRLAADAIEHIAFRGEIRRGLELFRGALDEKVDAMIITNPSREVIFWNRRAEMLFGYKKDEALGRKVADILVPSAERRRWKKGFDPHITRILEDGGMARFEAMRLHKSGRMIPVRVTLSPIRHNLAGIVTLTCIVRYEPI
jgi:PAS domain S-box-containing protein